MEPITSVVLSLRGFSSVTFGKTLTDFEVAAAMRKLKFDNRKCPIFHVKAILDFTCTSAQRKLLEWFAGLCSDIHFCRLSYNNNNNSLDTPFTSTLQDLMITFDEELTIVEKKLECYRNEVCQGSHLPPELTVVRLYHSFRKYSPLFMSIVNMIETYVSDMKYRKRCKRKSMQHPYHGCVGILSEIDILQQKASYSFDIGNSLLRQKDSNDKVFGNGLRRPCSREIVLSLRLHLSSPQESLFALFVRNLLPPFLEYTLNHVFQYTTKKISFTSSNDNFFNYTVNQLSSWTPNQTVLWAVTILLEYCKVDFDVLSRFRNMPILKENRNDLVSSVNKQCDVCDDQRITNLFKLENIDPFDANTIEPDLVAEYLLTGKRSTVHNASANSFSASPGFIDQHAIVVRSKTQTELHQQLLAKITNLLHFILNQQQQQPTSTESMSVSKPSSSEQLWKHSFDMYPLQVFHQLATLFDQVNLLSQKKLTIPATEERTTTVTSIENHVSFIHHDEFIRRQVFAPLCDHLNLVKISAFRILAQEFHLKQHLQFVSSVFLLGKIDLLQSYKELVLLLPIYHATEAVVPYRQFSTQHAIQSQSQWQSLSFTLEHAISEHKPQKGIQHFSVTMPSLLEAHRHRMLNKPSGNNALAGKSGENVFDESLLDYLISNLRFELHYSWPVSMLFPGSYIQRLQTIFQSLLSMMTLKWLSEAWWKAIIPKGGLRQFHILDRLRQRAMEKQRKLVTHKQRFGHKESIPARQPGDILEEMDDQDAREEEERLKQAQRNCQQAFIQVMHLSQLLSGYYLSRIHERVWPNVMRKSSVDSDDHEQQQQQQVKRSHYADNGDTQEGSNTVCTIEMVQIAIRDGLEFIEDLLSLIDKPMQKLLHCALKAFQELRQALAVEYSFDATDDDALAENEDEEGEGEEDLIDLTGEEKDYYAELQRQAMQHTQTTLPVGKKQVQQKHKRHPSLRFSRKKLLKEIAARRKKVSRMLVAYRMAEIAFEDVNQAREAVMLAILSWRAGATSASFPSSSASTATTPTGKSKLNNSNLSNNSAAKRAKKALARTPQSAWKMQQMQIDGKAWQKRKAAIKQTSKRLFEQESVMMTEGVDYHRWESMMVDEDDDGSDEDDDQPLQRAYGIEFLRCVEELQTQCTMLWTE